MSNVKTPTNTGKDIIIGLDSGTSYVKAVAFDLTGQKIALYSAQNSYDTLPDGGVEQCMTTTWELSCTVLQKLAEKVDNLAQRTAVIAITGQGDGTWLVDDNHAPIDKAWLWLDGRSAHVVNALSASDKNRIRFEKTGTGINTSQQAPQIIQMSKSHPHLLAKAKYALHCKEWLYLNMTGVVAADPSEVSFTYGNFRTRTYDDNVIDALDFEAFKHLLPPVLEGTEQTHPLTETAAKQIGLLANTPVCLGYVDMACTVLGSGVYAKDSTASCTILGSTGIHSRAVKSEDFTLNEACTGYAIPLPAHNIVAQIQSNMSATVNIDWVLQIAQNVLCDFDQTVTQKDLIKKIEGWLAKSTNSDLLYHPYISQAGERGPFVNPHARASLNGINSTHGYADMVRAVINSLAMAMRDCYAMMGDLPDEVIVTGGATSSAPIRKILAASVDAPIKTISLDETGAMGVAMMGAVAIGVYPTMEDCIAHWVTPHITPAENPDPVMVKDYNALYERYVKGRHTLENIWVHNAK